MPRVKGVTAGGSGISVATKIGPSTTTPATLANTVSVALGDCFFFDQQMKTTVAGGLVIGTGGEKLTLDSKKNTPELETWLAANQQKEPEAADSGFYEDGEKFTSSSGGAITDLVVAIGPYTSGKRQIVVTCGIVSSGDFDWEYNKVLGRPITVTTQEWNGTAALSIPAAFWDLITKQDGTTKIIDKTDTALAAPLTIPIGKGSVVLWVKALV